MYKFCEIIDLVTMKEVWNYKINNEVFCDNSRIVEIWSTPGPKKLGLKALNRKICWEIDKKTLKAWKVRFE